LFSQFDNIGTLYEPQSLVELLAAQLLCSQESANVFAGASGQFARFGDGDHAIYGSHGVHLWEMS
jgi:heme oxygenase